MITIEAGISCLIELKSCSISEYGKLSRFHYRGGGPGPVGGCFGLYAEMGSRIFRGPELVGIIVYSLPAVSNHLRNLATGYRYSAVKSLRSRTVLLNREMRMISRVIIHPQFRGLGLATKLVAATLPLAGTRFVEASAVMGLVHPFFQKAGMTMYTAPVEMKTQMLLAAFEHLEIGEETLADPRSLMDEIKKLKPADRRFLLTQIQNYYLTARRGAFSSGVAEDLERLAPRVAAGLFYRPAYFLWEKEN
jgi:hypothetical protein